MTGNIFFPLTVIYLEIVFSVSVGINPISFKGLIMLLFSVCYGLLIRLFTGLLKNRYINRIIKGLSLLLLAVIYATTYFVYCEFRVFYDLNTVFNAAGDAAGGFSYNIKILLLSTNGIIHLVLFFLPLLIFLMAVICKKDKSERFSKNSAVVVIALVLMFLSLAEIFIKADERTAHIYLDEYSFDQSVRTFGVLTSIRVDAQVGILGDRRFLDGEDTSFLSAPVPAVTSVAATSSNSLSDNSSLSENNIAGSSASENLIEEPEIIEYGVNALDIDYEALAEETTGNIRDLNLYVASLEPSSKNEYTGLFEGKNLIIITAEAFTAEVIDPELTPTLYRLANNGIQFTDYYQPAGAGTTGGEYSVLMGMLPTAGGASMTNTIGHLNYMTMGYQLNLLGYYGMAYHNNDYTYYSRNLTHVNLGYSGGYMGYGNGMEQYVSYSWPESDLEMIQGTLPTYIDNQPFNIYYMSVSGHSLYSRSVNAMADKHWAEVENLECSDTVKAYIASQLELEAALTYLVSELEANGIADDTVIVISADHFPYGLDSQVDPINRPYLTELYGTSISNDLVRDHNRLIIWSGCLEDMDPIVVDTPTFSPDITPTLLNLFGVEFDSRLMIGRDVFSDALPLMFDLGYDWKTDLGTYISATGVFVPVNEDVVIPDGYVEAVKVIVKNKIYYCKMVLATDYFRYLFAE